MVAAAVEVGSAGCGVSLSRFGGGGDRFGFPLPCSHVGSRVWSKLAGPRLECVVVQCFVHSDYVACFAFVACFARVVGFIAFAVFLLLHFFAVLAVPARLVSIFPLFRLFCLLSLRCLLCFHT